MWTARDVRQIILEESKRANVGHIGSCLSIADILTALYQSSITEADPKTPTRNRFILSKGHAALALYAVLRLKGWLSAKELATFCGENSFLGYHPDLLTPGIDFSSGSLGQGLSIGTGMALAERLGNGSRRVFVLLSDAECNEGAVWESIMFAAHHKLSHLIAIIDDNGQQALAPTNEILDLSPLAARWEAFGWRALNVDGHDHAALENAFRNAVDSSGRPTVIVCKTTFGKGVSFMERQIHWHYFPMSDEQYHRAITEVKRTG